MKAAVYAREGGTDVVRITDLERPVPQDDEVLIKVRAASVNPGDYHLKKGGATPLSPTTRGATLCAART